jgi:hypothetical protein
MNKPMKPVLEAFAVVLVGVFETAIAWLLYVGIYLGLESLFYPSNPMAFPADQVRGAVSMLFFLVYAFLIFPQKKLAALWKAALSIGPITAVQITIFFRLYQTPWVAAICVVLFGLIWVVWLKWKNQSWLLWFAVGAGTMLSLMYAWPQP